MTATTYAPGQRAYQAMVLAMPNVRWTPWEQLAPDRKAAVAAAEAVPPTPKRWFKSRTLWVNFFGICLACLVAVEQLLPTLQGVLPGSKITLVLALVLPVLNAALRFINTTELVK
jgi:hypothetical protein